MDRDDGQWSLSPSHTRLRALTLLPERPSFPPCQILRSNHLFRQLQPFNGARRPPLNLAATGFGVTPHLETSWFRFVRLMGS